MDRCPITSITLHRTRTEAFDQFHPIHCADLAEASRTLVRMARLSPPKGDVMADPVQVTVEWQYHSPLTFTYYLTACNLKAADLGGALEGTLLWERDHGSDRAESILRYCDLGQVEEAALLAA